MEVGCCFNTLTFFQPTVVMVAPRVLCQGPPVCTVNGSTIFYVHGNETIRAGGAVIKARDRIIYTCTVYIYIIIIIRVHHVQMYTRAILPHAALSLQQKLI